MAAPPPAPAGGPGPYPGGSPGAAGPQQQSGAAAGGSPGWAHGHPGACCATC